MPNKVVNDPMLNCSLSGKDLLLFELFADQFLESLMKSNQENEAYKILAHLLVAKGCEFAITNAKKQNKIPNKKFWFRACAKAWEENTSKVNTSGSALTAIGYAVVTSHLAKELES